MFQSLASKYTQPVAVFASKNPVKNEELAKLVVKAIAYVENIGAKIYGVIVDGAKTNTAMWSLLNIKICNHDMKTWFTHPLDNERKVFMFSDTPHLIKNVRNRLYNKRRLRINSKANYIEWKYFEILFNLDRNHVGNLRACPKLSERHVKLDNTSKMRVRLATQIFSNSVAHGLAFYKSHGCDELAGCEETIAFVKRMNDMFDVLNRKSPNEGLTPYSHDFKILKDSLQWLQEWESAVHEEDIKADEFLTKETAIKVVTAIYDRSVPLSYRQIRLQISAYRKIESR
ncbi:unnamed protein product [Lasius platythorax]|uniref:Transposable element P transposase n=1 Tax=Lasius platythorax TaxID=488582 RepID=A0AAV2NMQ8_9HYME